MSIRSPLARARGMGSAKDGVGHWWAQRVSAVALIPLSLWFVFSLLSHAGGSHASVVAWLSSPLVAVPLALYLGAIFYHSQLGLQVVVEDYVHSEWLKLSCLILLQFINIALAVSAIFAVLFVALGGAK